MMNPFRNIAGNGNPNLPANPKNPNWKIFFRHVATGAQVAFEGWVTDFSDNFTSEWNPTPVYGRMDPLATFQRTSRQITLSFDVPSASRQEAIDNTGNVDLLIKFLYPVYANGERKFGNVLKASPLVTLKWANLISNYSSGREEELVGYLSGVNYAPDVDAGFFMVRGEKLFPQLLKINFNFTVLHTVLPGWSITNKKTTTATTEETHTSYHTLGDPDGGGLIHERTVNNWTTTETGDWQFGNDAQHFPHAGNIPNNPILDNQVFGLTSGADTESQDASIIDAQGAVIDPDSDAAVYNFDALHKQQELDNMSTQELAEADGLLVLESQTTNEWGNQSSGWESEG